MNEYQQLLAAIYEATDAIRRAKCAGANLATDASYWTDPAYQGNLAALNNNLNEIQVSLEAIDTDVQNW